MNFRKSFYNKFPALIFPFLLFSLFPFYAFAAESNQAVCHLSKTTDQELFRNLKSISLIIRFWGTYDQSHVLKCHGREAECSDEYYELIRGKNYLGTEGYSKEKENYVTNLRLQYKKYMELPKVFRTENLLKMYKDQIKKAIFPYVETKDCKVPEIDVNPNPDKWGILAKQAGSLVIGARVIFYNDLTPPIALLRTSFYRADTSPETLMNAAISAGVTVIPMNLSETQISKKLEEHMSSIEVWTDPTKPAQRVYEGESK